MAEPIFFGWLYAKILGYRSTLNERWRKCEHVRVQPLSTHFLVVYCIASSQKCSHPFFSAKKMLGVFTKTTEGGGTSRGCTCVLTVQA